MTIGEEVLLCNKDSKYWKAELKRAQAESNRKKIDRETKRYWKARIEYCKEKIRNTK